MEDAKTFLVAKQQPHTGPKTPSRTVKKLEHLKKRLLGHFFGHFLTHPHLSFPSMKCCKTLCVRDDVLFLKNAKHELLKVVLFLKSEICMRSQQTHIKEVS